MYLCVSRTQHYPTHQNLLRPSFKVYGHHKCQEMQSPLSSSKFSFKYVMLCSCWPTKQTNTTVSTLINTICIQILTIFPLCSASFVQNYRTFWVDITSPALIFINDSYSGFSSSTTTRTATMATTIHQLIPTTVSNICE